MPAQSFGQPLNQQVLYSNTNDAVILKSEAVFACLQQVYMDI